MNIPSVIVCEDVRREIHGKISIIGYYGILPNVNIKVKEINKPIGRMLIFFTVFGNTGTYSLEFTITAPNENLIKSIGIGNLTIEEGVFSGALVDVSGFIPPVTGLYTLQLAHQKKTVYSNTFNVDIAKPAELDY